MGRQTFTDKELEVLCNVYIDRRGKLNGIKAGTRWAEERKAIWDGIAQAVNAVPNSRRKDPWDGSQCAKRISTLMTDVKKAYADRKAAEPTGNFPEQDLPIGVAILLEHYEDSAIVSGIKGGESSDLKADGNNFAINLSILEFYTYLQYIFVFTFCFIFSL